MVAMSVKEFLAAEPREQKEETWMGQEETWMGPSCGGSRAVDL
jgi:hypothetical protein